MQLGVKEAAQQLGISEKTVYRWLKDKKIPAYRIGDHYRFNRMELLEWATEQRISVSPELFDEPDDEADSLPRVADALRLGGIFYRVPGADKKSVIQAVVASMPWLGAADRQSLGQILLAREALGSTGIGRGIAIPHVRNPIVLLVTKPMITLCFLAQAVDFAAIDGEKVHTLFTIISPTTKAHLHLLSRLCYLLKDAHFGEILARRGTPEEIHEALRQAEGLMETKAALVS